MNIEIEKGISDFSLIIHPDDTSKIEMYESKMICENTIQNLLPVKERVINDRICYIYDVTGMQSLKDEFNTREIDFADVKELIKTIIDVGKALDEFLLTEDNLRLEQENVYIKNRHFYFLYFPCNETRISESLSRLSEFLISRVNHNDDSAVKMAYGFYNMVYSGDYAFDKLFSEYNGDSKCLEGENSDTDFYEEEALEEREYDGGSNKYKYLFSIIIIPLVLCIMAILGKI